MITRRLFLMTAAAGATLGAMPPRVWAGTTLDLGGGVRLDTLSDGNLVLPRDFILGGLPEAELAPILDAFGLTGDTLTPPCNVTLFRDGTNTVLFDAGSGPDFQPSAGKMLEALSLLNLAPEDVTHVLFTHAHPDHFWGVMDEFDEPLFANATHAMGGVEIDYWSDPATVGTIGAERETFAVGAARRIEAMGDALARIEDGSAPLAGITARLTPGHTPGHLVFEIEAGGRRALVVGDAIGNHHVAFARPDWETASDQDPPLAARTRSALIEQLAEAGTEFVGFHLPDGGIGRAERDGEGFRFVPA